MGPDAWPPGPEHTGQGRPGHPGWAITAWVCALAGVPGRPPVGQSLRGLARPPDHRPVASRFEADMPLSEHARCSSLRTFRIAPTGPSSGSDASAAATTMRSL